MPAPSPVASGHLPLCAVKPGPFPLPDFLSSFLVPNKTCLPGQHGTFQALLLWQWPQCSNPLCLNNRIKLEGDMEGNEARWMQLLYSPRFEEEPKGSNRNFCNWFLSERSPCPQMPSKRHEKLELEKTHYRATCHRADRAVC